MRSGRVMHHEIRYSDICYQMTKGVNSSRHRVSLTFGRLLPLCMYDFILSRLSHYMYLM